MSTEERVAQWLGSHALPAFIALLCAVAALALGCWWRWVRAGRDRGREPLPPRRLLVWRLLVGFATVVAASMLFAAMIEALDARAGLGRFDLALTQALREHVSATTLHVFSLLTHLGDTATLTVLCIAVALLLVWRGQRTLALGWVLAVAGNGVLNTMLKRVFQRVRPLHEHALPVSDSGFSFPSGHSSGAVVAYGMLAYLVLRLAAPRWRLPALLLAAAIAFSTGLSRVFLQVHYASDVLAGFASGSVWLAVCLIAVECLRSRRTGTA